MSAFTLISLYSYFFLPGLANSQPSWTGTSVCGKCGYVVQNDREIIPELVHIWVGA